MPAPKKSSRAQPLATMPEGRALRFTDITSKGQTALNRQVRPLGRSESRSGQVVARLNRVQRNPDAAPAAKEKAAQRLETHRTMSAAGAFSDVDITHEHAAGRRTELARAGIARAQREGGMGVRSGEDWYFQHHGKLADIASTTGHSKDRVIAASAVMSPQNNPDQEVQAVSALARAHSDPEARIKVTPQAAEVLRPTMPNVDDYVGKSLHPKRFGAEDLAAVSNPAAREHIETTGDVDLPSMAKGGVKGNVTKAIGVLRGDVPHGSAIDPHSSPKVWSYHEAIKNSVPGTPEHEEFMSRVDVATRQIPGQSRLDLFGKAHSQEGILSSAHPTAEDTWMQAISTGQQLQTVAIPGRTGRANMQSPAKFSVGEGGAALDKQIRSGQVVRGGSSASAMHAWQSHATETAARSMGDLPSVAVQAMAWTEARRQAGGGKDAPYESRLAAFQAPAAAHTPSMFTSSGQPRASALPTSYQGSLNLGVRREATTKVTRPKKSRTESFQTGSLF